MVNGEMANGEIGGPTNRIEEASVEMRRWVANLIYSTSVPPPGGQRLNFRLGLQENNDSVINFKVNNLSSAWRLPIQRANRPTNQR